MGKLLKYFAINNENNNIFSDISEEFKYSFIATFVFGLIAHTFMFANPIFGHDASNLYWPATRFSDAAAQARWLVPFWQSLLDNVYQPWLCGILTLIIYSFVSYFICRYFNIKRVLPIALISGIMITAPTAISSNMYLSSAYIYAIALLFAVLSAYCYKNCRFGWIWSFVFMFLCGGTYTAYVSFAVSLFILHSVVNIITGRYTDFVKTFLYHIGFVAISVAGMLANVAVIVLFGGHSSVRGVSLAGGGDNAGFVKKILDIVQETIGFFGVSSHVSFMRESVLFYLAFLIAVALTVAAATVLIFKNGVFKKLSIGIMLFDIICLPLAMDIIGVFYESHLLMRAAFIIPWIAIIVIYEECCKSDSFISFFAADSKKALLGVIYTVAVIGFSLFTISHRTVLANVCYTKAYANYQAGLNTASRIADRIESADGYVPGETKVVFIGSIKGNRHGGAYSLGDSVTGIGSDYGDGYWDSAIPAAFSLKAFIQQHLAYDIDILNETYYMSIYYADKYFKEYNAVEYYPLLDQYDTLDAFPGQNCYAIHNDLMVFKLS